MIYVDYKCRFGNVLFSYVFSKLLSHLSGVSFTYLNIKNFKFAKHNSSNAIIDFDESHIITDKIPDENSFILNCGNYCNLDLDNLCELAKKRDIVIETLPLAADYFTPHRKWIKENIKIKGNENFVSKELAAHIRLGDYFPSHGKPNKAFYYPINSVFNLLYRLKFEKVTIVTDTPNYPELLNLSSPYNCEIISNNFINDFLTLVNAKRLITTPSTFSWWASFLSDSEEIYYPAGVGNWKVHEKLLFKDKHIKYYDSIGGIYHFKKNYINKINISIMKLPNPIIITKPEKKYNDVIVTPQTSKEYSEVNLTILDDELEKTVRVKIENSQFTLLLWSGTVYDLAGDYTQKQVEDRVLELLGDEGSRKVSKLFGYTEPVIAKVVDSV
jgi:hypothetical protein